MFRYSQSYLRMVQWIKSSPQVSFHAPVCDSASWPFCHDIFLLTPEERVKKIVPPNYAEEVKACILIARAAAEKLCQSDSLIGKQERRVICELLSKLS